jgi:phenylalanyl-tRNA synthetase beta chain
LAPYPEDAAVSALSDVKTTLAGLGLREIMNYSLTAPALLDLFDAGDQVQRIVLPHPISADQSVLRPSLIPQMVETLGRNHARQMTQALFYESGRVYQLRDGQPWEENRIALGLLGPVGRDAYRLRAAIRPDEMFGWMKGLLESLLAAQRIREWSVQAEAVAGLEPGQSVAVWIDGQRAGVMGLVARRIRKAWRLNDPVAVAEISTAALLQHTREIPTAQAVAVFPSISRDMALVVQQSVSHEDIMAIIRQNAGAELEKIELFDIFEGEAIGAGKKSMAYSVTYRSSARTLTDEEANVYHERVKDAIRSNLDVVIREGA